MIISPHSHTRLYFAANKLFRSDDRGNSWRAISGDLTRKIDRNKLPVMGKVWGPDAVAKSASTSLYGNITALAESPKREGLIYVGTDDGLIQVTEDNGANWRKIEKFPGVPEMTYVTRLLASVHDTNTVYACFDNHKNSDFAPYVLKSTDMGKSWNTIKANLPTNGPVLAIEEDHVNADLIFLGTEFGLYFTINGGQQWVRLGGLPTIAIKDLAIQQRENDLVVATFGRGIYILDDYTPLRGLKSEMLMQDSLLFPVKSAWLYIPTRPYGGKGKSFQGEALYTAENPAYGATFTYYLKEALKTKKQLRQEAEKKGDMTYPTNLELREEAEEEESAILLTITDTNGKVVRRLTGSNNVGINRINWDLRYATPVLPPSNAEQDSFSDDTEGPLVIPGNYTVSLAKRVNGALTPLATPQSFTVVVLGTSTTDRSVLVDFQRKVARLQRAVVGAIEMANSVKSRMALIKRALQETPDADNRLTENAVGIEKSINDVLRLLRGDNVLRARNENTPTAIAERVDEIVDGQRRSTASPTQTHIDNYRIAAQEFEEQLARLRKLIEVDLANLEKAMEAANAPWTPGRIPQWQDK